MHRQEQMRLPLCLHHGLQGGRASPGRREIPTRSCSSSRELGETESRGAEQVRWAPRKVWKRHRQAFGDNPGLCCLAGEDWAWGRGPQPPPPACTWLLCWPLTRQMLFAFLSFKTMWCCDTLQSSDKCLIKGFNLIRCQNLIRSTMHRRLGKPFN